MADPNEPLDRRARVLRFVEIAIASLVTIAFLVAAPLRLYAGIAGAGIDALVVALPLTRADPPTAIDACIALLRSALVVAPIIAAFARAERRRLVWAPLTLIPLLLALSLAPHGLTGWLAMTVLAVVSIGAVLAQANPWLRWTAALPALLALHPTTTTHQAYSLAVPGARERLIGRCAENDGERALGAGPALYTPLYYAVTPFDDRRLLLTAEGNLSRWVVREPDGRLRIGEPSSVTGNYWHGTHGLGAIWLGHRDDVRRVTFEDGHEVSESISLLEVREPWEVDALDAVFEEETRAVFVGELASGSLLRVPIDGEPRRFEHGLFYLQLAPGARGEVIGISTTELVVIDAASGSIRERQPAALCAGGVATCALDHAVAVTDFAGRVRLFERRGDGYRLARATSAPSPRRVAFSPDCSALAVTSADDETLLVLSRDDLSVLHRYRLGPGLRDVYWTSDRELLAVDACTVTRLRPSDRAR